MENRGARVESPEASSPIARWRASVEEDKAIRFRHQHLRRPHLPGQMGVERQRVEGAIPLIWTCNKTRDQMAIDTSLMG